MPLTQLHDRLAIDFSQTKPCLALLHEINATNTEEAGQVLLALLEGMAVNSPGPDGHLKVLEEARQPLEFVLAEASKRYASRPLPPASAEEEVLQRVTRLWSMMSASYGLVAQHVSDAPQSGLSEQKALLAQRRIHYHSQVMIEFFRARREMPAGLWQDLHAQYQAAENREFAEVRVPDSLNETWGAQSVKESYVALLLIDAASPYSRTPREFAWLTRWAQRFAPYCSLQEGVDKQDKASSFVLDLFADSGLRPIGQNPSVTSLHSLNTTKLATHIQAVVHQLKKGVSAASLGLGDDCVQPACARLLVSLYRPWGLASSGRRFPRHRAGQQVQVCTDLLAAAFFLSGREFTQEGRPKIMDFTRAEALLTLGERVDEGELSDDKLNARAVQLGYALEPWDIIDQSVAGFKIARQESGSRVEHRQLLGLRIPQGERLLLAEVSWLQFRQDGVLSAGVSILPSPPSVVAVRIVGSERGSRDQFRLAFIAPPVPAFKTEASLLIPAGWFQSDRRLLVQADNLTWQAKLDRLISRGSNFDRVSFVRE